RTPPMLSAIDLFRPASSWNWLANLTSAARLASSLTILSWSLSVIEGTPPVWATSGGTPDYHISGGHPSDNCRPFERPSRPRLRLTLDAIRCVTKWLANSRLARKKAEPAGVPRAPLDPARETRSGPPEHGLHPDRQAHVALDLELAAHERGGRIEA